MRGGAAAAARSAQRRSQSRVSGLSALNSLSSEQLHRLVEAATVAATIAEEQEELASRTRYYDGPADEPVGGADAAGAGARAVSEEDEEDDEDEGCLDRWCVCVPSKRHAAVRELFWYVIFLAVFMSLVLTRAGLHGFSTRFDLVSAAQNQFTPSEPLFDAHGNRFEFEQLALMSDVWGWLEGPFTDRLSALTVDRSGASPVTGEAATYFERSVVIGNVLLHQRRGKLAGCDLTLGLVGDDSCVPRVSVADESRDAYGDSLQFTYSAAPQASINSRLLHDHRGLPHGGFFHEIDMSLAGSSAASFTNATTDALRALRAAGWTDKQTLTLSVDFALLHPSTSLVTAVHIYFLVEGGVRPHAMYRVHRLFQYESDTDWVLFSLEVLTNLFVVKFLLEEAGELWTRRLAYFGDVSNYLDMLNLGLFVATIVLRGLADAASVELRDEIGAKTYVNLQPLAYTRDMTVAITAFNTVLTLLKVFKYLNSSPSMSQLARVLSRAAKSLGIFVIIFFLVFVAFSLGFYLAFSKLEAYSTVARASLTLFGIMLGDFSLRELRREHDVMAPLLFAFFVIIIVFVLFQMWSAIIIDSFTSQFDELKPEKRDPFAAELQDWARSVAGRFRRLVYGRKRARVAPAPRGGGPAAAAAAGKQAEIALERLGAADANKNNRLDINELEAAVSSKHATLFGAGLAAKAGGDAPTRSEIARDVMRRFDADGDGELDEEEMEALRADVRSRAIAARLERLSSAHGDTRERLRSLDARLSHVASLLEQLLASRSGGK